MKSEGSMVFRTALGWSGVAVSARGVMRVVLPRKDRMAVQRELADSGRSAGGRSALVRRSVKLLQRYFAGVAVDAALPRDLGNATAFQRSVWNAATAIPRGETRSYAWVARKAGRPSAARAVGQAMAANPLPVLIP